MSLASSLTIDNCDVVEQLVIKNSDKCLETKQITKNSPVPILDSQFVDGLSDKCTSGCTELNLCREVLCQVVQQKFTDFSEMVPVWDCKLAKQMKLQQAATVPDFKKWKSQNKFAFGFIPLSPLLGQKIGKIMAKFTLLLKLIT